MATEERKTERAIKGVQSTRPVSKWLKTYFFDSFEAKKTGEKVIAWAGGYTVYEITHVFPMIIHMVDNFGAFMGTRQLSSRPIELAEGMGYSHSSTCSYYRNIIGYMLEGIGDPEFANVVGAPAPDIVLGGLQPCFMHGESFRILGRHYGVPTFVFDNPAIHPRMDIHEDEKNSWAEHSHCGGEYKHKVESHYMDYTVAQAKDLVAFLEKHTKTKYDEGKFREVLQLSDKQAEIFEQIWELRRAYPCPIGGNDMMALITPQLLLSGTELGVEIYEGVLKEVKEKVENKEGGIPEEKYRLVTDAIPPWYNMGGLYNYLREKGAISVAETYTMMWQQRLDLSLKPIETLADKIMRWYTLPSTRERADSHLRLLKRFDADGLLLWTPISCKVYPCWNSSSRDLAREYGYPVLELDIDQTDPRDYDDAGIKSRIDGFLEVIETRKRAQKG